MATKFLILTALLLPLSMARSAEEIAGALRKGLFEEEVNHDLEAAMQSYQSVIRRFDEDRKLAATAVFRLGECYRKQGKTKEAQAQYQRIVRDFSDQVELVKSSQVALGPEAKTTTLTGASPSTELSAEAAEIERLKAFLKDSPDLINGSGKEGVTPLQEAARQGRLQVLAWLIEQKAEINFKNNKGTALHFAVSTGNRSATEFLISRGADPNLGEEKGNTPLHLAAGKGFKAVCELLIKAKADVNARNGDRETPLLVAHDPKIVQFLLANKADVEAYQKDNFTPLVNAAASGNLELMKLFLAHGAGPNNPDGKGAPLFWAVEKGQVEAAELLLKNKADPNKSPEASLLRMAFNDKNMRLAEMLVSHGVDVDKDRNGHLYLSEAINNDDEKCLRFLLTHGANPNGDQSSDRSDIPPLPPLLHAITQQRTEFVELLLSAGADPNSRTSDKGTLLGIALHNPTRDSDARKQIVELLLKAGANPNGRDGTGITPLERASGNAELADLLRAHGASEFVSSPTKVLVTRIGSGSATAVLAKDRQGYNRHTLFDAIEGGQRPFSDLSRITIHRSPSGKGQQPTKISVNVLKDDQSLDMAKDLPLEFGDIIELPERPHQLNETDQTFSQEQIKQLWNRHQRKVTFKSGSKIKEITVHTPRLHEAIFGSSNDDNKELLEFLSSTADFSRVRVTRVDPVSKENVHYTADIRLLVQEVSWRRRREGGNPPINYQAGGPLDDVWLLDGDCIEIPEKN